MSADGAPRLARGIGLTVLTAVAIVAIVTAGWLIVRGHLAKDQLQAAVSASENVAAAVEVGDFDGAAAAVARLDVATAAATSLTDDLVWRVAEVTPIIGPNLTAVRVVSAQANALARDVAAPLVGIAASFTAGSADGVVVDVDALAESHEALAGAASSLATAAGQLDGVETALVVAPLRDGIAQLKGIVAEATPAIGGLADTSAVLPSMLGQEGPRTLLIMLQNTAELRTAGGITGTFIAVRADRGSLTIIEQADSSHFDAMPSSILPIPDSLTQLYGDVTGRFVQNTSMSADFDLTARLASQWWSIAFGVTPDAVIAVDPLVLQSILAATGPVSTPQGPLAADDVVDRLLVEPYRVLDQDAQTTVFEDAATAVFDVLTTGAADPIQLVEALAAPAAEGRISVWSAHADEQAVLAETTLAGPAARQRAAGTDAYAVYFNDATGGKMDTLLEVDIASGIAQCRPDGRGDVVVRVTLTSRAPADADSLPFSMTGGGAWGVAPGHIATSVAVSAPAGSFFGAVTVDGGTVAPVGVTDAGFEVSATEVDLAPGESKTIEFRFISADSSAGTPVILHTPLVADPTLRPLTPVCA